MDSKRPRWGGIAAVALCAALCAASAWPHERPLLDWISSKLGTHRNSPDAQPLATTSAGEAPAAGTAPPTDGRAWVQMATSPDGGALQLVVNTIESAHTSIRVAAYSFTSKSIAAALVRKHKAGVSVTVLMDKSQLTEKYTSATFLANAGIPVRINSRYAIQHSKILIVDGDTVQSGSFNYTEAASRRNSENVLVVWHHAALAKQYGDYWRRLWEEGEPYEARN